MATSCGVFSQVGTADPLLKQTRQKLIPIPFISKPRHKTQKHTRENGKRQRGKVIQYNCETSHRDLPFMKKREMYL